jgi:fluoride exporter
MEYRCRWHTDGAAENRQFLWLMTPPELFRRSLCNPMVFSLALLLKAMGVGISGAFGAGTRHLVSVRTRRLFGEGFPWGTLFINLSGALAIGLVAGLLSSHHALESWHAPLVLGFLGGYTTFSTLMLEIVLLRRRDQHGRLWGYLLASILLGPFAVVAGLAIGGWL